jgi:hypothetical protein
VPLSGREAALASRQLAELHRIAQERLGLSAYTTAFAAWQQLSTSSPNPADWYEEIVRVTNALRAVSEVLAARYYTLARAIGSGYALPDYDGGRAGNTVTMGELYTEFASALNEVIETTSPDLPGAGIPAPNDNGTESDQTLDERLDSLVDVLVDMFEQVSPEPDSDDWLETVPVDSDWDWTDFGTDDDEARDSLEELLTDLDEQVIEEIEKAVQKELSSDRGFKDAQKRIDDTARNRGAHGSGLVDQYTMKPGRDLVRRSGEGDRRRYGWMRVTGPNPCAFCSMLASRGAVYDTKESAGQRQTATGYRNTYHPNCHCHVVAVWLNEPYYSARDQFFIDNWEKVTKAYYGKGKLRAWRKWLTEQYRDEKVPDQDIYGPARASK